MKHLYLIVVLVMIAGCSKDTNKVIHTQKNYLFWW